MTAEQHPRRGARQVLRNTAILAVSRVCERSSSLVIALLIAAHLGAEGLGAYAIAMAVYNLFAYVGDAGTQSYLIREVAKDPGRTGPYVVHLSLIAGAAALVLMGLGALVVPHLGYAPTVETSVLIVVLAVLPRTLNALQEAVFVAHGRTEFQAVTTITASALLVGASAVLLATGHDVPSLVITHVALQYAICVVYFTLISAKIAPLRARVDGALLRRLVFEIRNFAATTAVAALFSRPEVIILSLLASEREVGLYSAAVRIAEVWLFVPEVFMNNVYPMLSEAAGVAEERFARIQRRALRAVMGYALPIAAGTAATAPLLIDVLFGDEFEPAADLLRTLSLTVVFSSLIAVFWRSLYARGREDAVLHVLLVMLGVRIGGGVALIAPLGVTGAAIATPLSSLVHATLLGRAVKRSGAPIPSLRDAAPFAAAATAMGAVLWALTASGAALWLVVPAGAVLYAIGLVAFGALAPEDRALLRGALRVRSPVGARPSR